MAIPDPLDLPSGGRVFFRDSAVHFKRGHHKRLATVFETREDGSVLFSVRSQESWAMTDVMAEALVESWAGTRVGVPWYLDGRPIPGEDPSVMADVSAPDLAALGAHLAPLALETLGLTLSRGKDDDEGKAEPPSAASNGSTPISGSEASTPRATPAVVPVDLVTTLSVDSQIL